MILRCPLCHQELQKEEHRFVCPNGHSFDRGRGGYVNLSLRQSAGHGDEKRMVRARTAFLQTGNYAFLRQRLVTLLSEAHPQVLADLGCGEGYYTSAFPAAEKYGFDLSRDAVAYASRHDPSTQYVVASSAQLPLKEACLDVCVVCFAPLFPEEAARVLKPGGLLLSVHPGPRHLYALKEVLYEQPYENSAQIPVPPGFTRIHQEIIRSTFLLKQEQLEALLAMTPYLHRTPKKGLQKLQTIAELNMQAEFLITLDQNPE